MLHRQRRARDAKTLYERILAQSPDHLGALQGLGVLAAQAGQFQIADRLLEPAAALAPRNAGVHFHRAKLFHRMGLTDQALAAYDQIIAQEQGHAAAHANRGVLLERLGRIQDAIAAFDRAISAKPDFAAAHSNRGNALQKADRFAKPVECCDRDLFCFSTPWPRMPIPLPAMRFGPGLHC